MPIITISKFAEPPEEDVSPAQVQSLADRLGNLFGSGKRQTWVRVESRPGALYAENGGAEAGVYPTFVEVLKARLAEPEELAAEAEQIAMIVSAVLGCPLENTHVLYPPEAAGRIAFGGSLDRQK